MADELMGEEEFYGCARACWPRNKPRKHTLVWGECAHAPESARPEPRLTVMRHRIAEDGYPELVGEPINLSELMQRIEKALRTVPVTFDPKALKLLEDGHQMHLTGREYASMALAVAMDLIEEGS